MTDPDPRLDDIREIRSMMEKSSKFLSLSGLSGIAAGILATLGALAVSSILSGGGGEAEKVMLIVGVGAAVLLLALATSILLTTRLSSRHGERSWSPAAKMIVFEMAAPLLAGGALTLLLVFHRMYAIVPGNLLVFYGLALVATGKSTRVEVRYLGWVEILLGTLGMLYFEHALTIWAIGFGLVHIMYGALIYFKYEL